MIFAFSDFFGIKTSFQAEAMALLLGLQFYFNFKIYNLFIECDSKVLVEMINGRRSHPWKTNVLFKKLSRYKCIFQDASHCFRETNMVADRLTAEGQVNRESKLYMSWAELPSNVRPHVLYDSMRMCNFRWK